MEIRLFKTTVKTQWEVKQIAPQLTELLKNRKWNFDLEDCDNLLRIEGTEIPENQLEALMHKYHQELVEIN